MPFCVQCSLIKFHKMKKMPKKGETESKERFELPEAVACHQER